MLFDYLSGSRFVADLFFVVYPYSCYCLILLKKLNLDQEFFEYLLHAALVIVVGGAYEFIVGDVHQPPDILYLRGYAVDELLGRDALFGSLLLYLLPVLVGAGHKIHVVALHPLHAGEGVGKDYFVGVAYVRLARSVGYSRGYIKFFRHLIAP